jgi:drug/metabolite transporter (DMT)-like permease
MQSDELTNLANKPVAEAEGDAPGSFDHANRFAYLNLFLGGILDAAGELLLKHGADAAEAMSRSVQSFHGLRRFILDFPGISGLASGWTWLGIVCYILGLLCWLYVLRSIALSIAFPVINALHMAVPVGARFLLHEAVPGRRWLGIGIALAGVLLILKPVAKAEEKL